MKYRSQYLLTSSLVLGLLALPAMAMGAIYYVDAATGNDSSNGCAVEGLPCKTITYAATQVPAGTAGASNVIMVAEGNYSETGNGESYPVTFIQDYVSLTGTPGTTIIDADNLGYEGLIFEGTGFSVTGFTFKNTSTAITMTDGKGGYTISNNTFNSSVDTGVQISLVNSPSDNVNFTVDPISFINNTFASTDYGVDFSIGLSFDDVTTGLTAVIGNITVTNNTFTGASSGFDVSGLYIRNMASGTATVGNVFFTGNTFTNCGDGVKLFDLYFEAMDNSTATWGDITVDGNTFTDCENGVQLDDLNVDAMNSSTVTWGNITVDGNTFTANATGIDFAGYFGSSGDDLVDTTLSMGNVSVSNNTLTDNSSRAIDVDYFDVEYLQGSTTVLLGDLTVHNNTIEADINPMSGDGISIDDIGSIVSLYDTAVVTTGTVAITDNTVESSNYALFVQNYGVYTIGTSGGTDTVAVTFGAINIRGNKLTSSNNNAAYLDIDYLGYEQYAQTKVDVGLITLHDNDMTATGSSDALYFYYYYESGYEMYDDAQLSIEGLVFTDNRISSTGGYGVYFDLYELGYNLYDNSKMTVGPSVITGNTITSDDEALYFDFEEIAYYMYNSSVFSMSPWNISNNTLTSNDSTDYATLTIYYYDYYVGSNMKDDASATLPDWIISNNTIDVTGGDDGIYYHTYSNPDDNYGNAAVHFGSMLMDNNVFNENKDSGMDRAIDFWIEDVCEDCYDSSTFSHGDITVTNNTIYNVADNGIHLDYDDVGYSFDADGQVTMGDVTIADNTVDIAAVDGIYVDYAGLYSENSAVVTLGTLDITGNVVKGVTGDGIRVSVDGSIDAPTATLNIGKTTIADNTVTASATPAPKTAGIRMSETPPDLQTAGIWINGDINPGVLFAASEVNGNTVSGFGVGLGFDDLQEASMRCNTVENNSEFGLFFISDGNFTATYNSLLGNGLGIKIEDDSAATVMAEKNWWGDASGPVACASCNKINAGAGTVDFDPWLTGAPRSQCGGFSWPMFMPAIGGAGIH